LFEGFVEMSRSEKARPHILVFDSGLGGLSVVDELVSAGLDVHIFHCADTAFFPYGEKDDASLMARVPLVVRAAASACAADLVIVACNTASTIALELVRASVGVPVVGVVPAIKPAAAQSKSGTIGLLATPGTVRRPYTDALIADFAQNVRVVRHGAIGLAGTVEQKLAGGVADPLVLEAAVNGLFGQAGGAQIDVVVLACTHYPLVQAELKAFAPRAVTWLDSGAAIARRAATVLGLGVAGGVARLTQGFTTGGDDAATRAALLGWGFASVERLGLEAMSSAPDRVFESW
jgi:glutamate racemase